MIFYELAKLYQNLVKQGKVSAPGWMDEKVSYGINLKEDGTIEKLILLKNDKGKPQIMSVPQHLGRSGNKISAFFLWDNSKYLLGLDEKTKQDKAMERFKASKKLHLDLLKGINTEAASAIRNFFLTWEPENVMENEQLGPHLESLIKGCNLLFYHKGEPATTDSQIAAMWEQHVKQQKEGEMGICLVTGEKEPIAKLHPAIKGVRDAQPSGAFLVSFNENAFNSYEKSNGGNSPVSESVARAYGAALNYLLSDTKRVFTIGDITVTGWVEEGETAYQDLMISLLNPNKDVQNEDIYEALKKLSKGESIQWKEQEIDPNRTFYILGISPNAARLSVRLFLKNSFGSWLENIREHEKRLEIVLPSYVEWKHLPPWMILGEIRAPGDKDTIPCLTAALLQSVLRNSKYPNELLNCTIRRIRSDHNMNWKRAAILKAYLIKNSTKDKNKEVCDVGLNTETNNQAYLLGRLFSLLENIQETSAGGTLNSSIKDRHLNSMCSTPGLVISRLFKLKECHMKKLRRDKPGLAVRLDQQVTEIVDRLEIKIPTQLSQEEQAAFMLGYYHQTQKRYEKKQEEE